MSDERVPTAVAQALAAVSRLLAQSLGPEVVAQRIADSVRALLDTRVAGLYHVVGERLEAIGISGAAGLAGPGTVAVPNGLAAAAIRDQRAVVSADILADPRVELSSEWRGRLEALGVRASMAVPLRLGEHVVGALVTGAEQGRRFTAEDVWLAEAFADLAALALDNARRHAGRARRLRVLARLNALVTSSLETEHVLAEIAAAAAELLEAKVAGVWMLDPMTQTLELLGRSDPVVAPAAMDARAAVGEGALGWVAQHRRPVVIDDVRADPRVASPARILAHGLTAIMILPVIGQDRLLGVLGLGRGRPFRLDADEEELVQGFAAQAAVAIDHARLFEDARQRQEASAALARAGRLFAESLDVSAVGHRVVEAILPLVGAGWATLRRVNPDGTREVVAVAGTVADRLRPGDIAPADRGGTGWSTGRGTAAWTRDILAEPDAQLTPEQRAMLAASDLRAVIAIPLRSSAGVIGLLAAGAKTGREFTRAEVDLVEAFAGQAAVALENARLFEEGERRRREAEVLAAVAGSISASLDLDVVLQRVVEGARDLCESDTARIALREEGTEVFTFRSGTGYRRGGVLRARVEAGRGLGGLVLAGGRPVRTDSWTDDPRLGKDYLDVILEEGIIAQLAVPIRIAERIEGLLYVDRRRARPFTDRDEALLTRFADHAAIALVNVRLFTERVRTETALRESEGQYRLLAENAADVISVFGLDFSLRYVSPSVRGLRGYTEEETLAQSVEERVGAGSLAEIRRVLDEELRREAAGGADPRRSRTMELEVRHKDGSMVWTETSLTFVRDETGRPAGILAVSRDISARRRAEAALRRSEDQLRQAQKMEAIGLLAGGVAHDFNNLLTVIGGRAELLAGDTTLPANVRRDVELIERTAERAAQLTRQLLAFSRKQVLEPRVLDLNGLLDNMGRMLRRLIGEDIELTVVARAGLGRVHADPGQIEQVVMNLVVNARDAMVGGGRIIVETANVELDEAQRPDAAEAPPGGYAMLAVSDTGAGMDAATRARIFEPFFTTKEAGRGTGLGLSTVYGIVSQSGGHIRVYSEPGHGSTFKVYLPRVADRETAAGAAPLAPPPRGTETVLLVEDEEAVRELAREMLEIYGYTVVDARDGLDALAAAERHAGPIHLLVTDVVMPRMKGPELAAALAAAGRVERVLFVSGYTDMAAIHHGLAAGAQFLQKPFSPGTLARKVREVLDAPRAAR